MSDRNQAILVRGGHKGAEVRRSTVLVLAVLDGRRSLEDLLLERLIWPVPASNR